MGSLLTPFEVSYIFGWVISQNCIKPKQTTMSKVSKMVMHSVLHKSVTRIVKGSRGKSNNMRDVIDGLPRNASHMAGELFATNTQRRRGDTTVAEWRYFYEAKMITFPFLNPVEVKYAMCCVSMRSSNAKS